MKTEIRSYQECDRAAVASLWQEVFGYSEARNDPLRVIEEKLRLSDDLLLVALADGVVGSTLMAGYDGHRGWFYRLAVSPHLRRGGLASALVREAERRLSERGCLKINLQTHIDNDAAVAFWRALGYRVEERVSMGKDMSGEAGEGDQGC